MPRGYLVELADVLHSPIYWLGPRPGRAYELTVTRAGVYVRYLPLNVSAGTDAKYPFVATYSIPDAYRALRAAGRRRGTVMLRTHDGGEAFFARRSPKNVYLAYPHSDWEIEVFDPSPGRARRLVLGGGITHIGAIPERRAAPPEPPPPSA